MATGNGPRSADSTPLVETFNPYRRIRENALVPIGILPLKSLSQGAKLLYGLLRRYAGEDGRCFPSRDRLANELGVSPRRVTSYLAELRREGFIGTPSRPGGGVNHISFLLHPNLGVSEPNADQQVPGPEAGRPIELGEEALTEAHGEKAGGVADGTGVSQILPDRVERDDHTEWSKVASRRGSSKQDPVRGNRTKHAYGVDGFAGHEVFGDDQICDLDTFLRDLGLQLSAKRLRFLARFDSLEFRDEVREIAEDDDPASAVEELMRRANAHHRLGRVKAEYSKSDWRFLEDLAAGGRSESDLRNSRDFVEIFRDLYFLVQDHVELEGVDLECYEAIRELFHGLADEYEISDVRWAFEQCANMQRGLPTLQQVQAIIDQTD